MRAAFVTHSGPKVGLGHLRRCLTLARCCRDRGATVGFVLAPGSDGGSVRVHGFELHEALASFRPQIVVADSYDLDGEALAALRAQAPTAVIDDLADRTLEVDLIVNGGVQAEGLQYRALPSTRLLLGPRYALLAPEYRDRPPRTIRDRVERVLVTTGGADPAGAIGPLVRATRRALPTADIDAVIGPYVTWPGDLPGVAMHRSVPSLLPFLEGADLAVTGGGQTTYELAATGTPAVVVCLADNQRPQVEAFARLGTLVQGGDIRQSGVKSDGVKSDGVKGDGIEQAVAAAIEALASDPRARQTMSRQGQASLDGEGPGRVAAALAELC